ncbi:MAG: C-terminal helicase domain-containing protein [Gemmatimonadales bacterium]
MRALQTRLDAGGDSAALDRLGEQLFELDPEEGDSPDDLEPAADTGSAEVQALLREANRLAEAGNDPKLEALVQQVKVLLDDGFSPIVFCHYIATAAYVADALTARFRSVQVKAVTGQLPSEARIDEVESFDLDRQRVLVATDCLSEGVNLQAQFNAVIHYDLSWNPTRHEQREGRVDRFGQQAPTVRAVLLYGANNPVDGAVLQVIIKKAKAIADRLGVPVPLPDEEHKLTEALLRAVLLRSRGASGGSQITMDLPEMEEVQELDAAWHNAEERAKRAITKFAQRRLKPEEVEPEFIRAQEALGDLAELRRFVMAACARVGSEPSTGPKDVISVNLGNFDAATRERLDATGIGGDRLRVVPGDKAVGSAIPMQRSHPLPTVLAEVLLERTLDADGTHGGPAVLGRTGVWATAAVSTRTVLLLTRLRHELTITQRGGERVVSLVEEALPVAIVAGTNTPLTDADASALLLATPTGTLLDAVRGAQLQWLTTHQADFQQALGDVAKRRAEALLADHRRVRDAARARGTYSVLAKEPVDVVGAWILLPVAGS